MLQLSLQEPLACPGWMLISDPAPDFSAQKVAQLCWLLTPKDLVSVTAISSFSMELAPTGQESGQDCERTYGQAPIRSRPNWELGFVGFLGNDSTDHIKGTSPVPFRVKPEPRKPG